MANDTVYDEITEKVIQAHLKASGGLQQLEAINSIHFAGNISMEQGSDIPFVMIKKKPNLMRMTLNPGVRESLIGYDGTQVWQKRPGIQEARRIDPDKAVGIRTSAPIYNTLIYTWLGGQPIEYLGLHEIAGDTCHGFSIYFDELTTSEIYIDERTGLESKQRIIRRQPGEDPHITDIYFDDFREVEGVTLPFRFVNIVHEGLRSEVNIDEVNFNVGIYERYFWMPGWEPKDRPEIDLTATTLPE